jgi:molybdopterin/thiamine biosynthesis adenylyltransferase
MAELSQSKLSTLRIAICGAGAIGSNLADNLARLGAKKLRVIDHDRVEQHNIATQIYGEADVGLWKVEALRNHLFRACGVEMECVRRQLTADNARALLKDVDLIVDGFDNSQSRQCVQDAARAAGVACLHVGLHEDYCEVVWDGRYRVPRDPGAGDVCAHPLARNLVLMAVAVASETVLRWLESEQKVSRSATLGDFGVRVME